MRKLVLAIIVLFLFSCTNETPLEKSISDYVKSNFKDPSSSEKISIEVSDTVTAAKKIAVYDARGISHEELNK